ncbi:MAG: hypothetical protein DI538_01985 [Azospira oryzae]|nr:MAG: hypothetical protein DI538_01985 [Azospira oryzae]
MFQLTPVVRNLIIINVIVFLLQQIIPVAVTRTIEGEQVALSLTQLISLWSFKFPLFQPYQFFTYMFAHGGFMHILFNMLALASFGPILEQTWGDKKFLFYYLATGIGAGVIYTLVNLYFSPGVGSMVGASGAIYGLLMGFGLMYPNMEVSMLFIPIPIKAKYLVFIMGFITYLLDRSGSVAHVAHFGGAFVGFIIINAWGSGNRNWR